VGGRGKTVANGGQEDRCDGPDVLVKRRSSTVGSEKDKAKRLKDLEKENSRMKRLLDDAELDSGVSGGRIGMTEEMRIKFSSPAKRQRAVEQTRVALGHDRMTA